MITAAGDSLCQLVVESQDVLDGRRVLVCSCLGATLDGAALQQWYKQLHVHLPGRCPVTLAHRLLLHNAVGAPLLIAAFVATTAALEGHAAPWDKVSQEWVPGVCAHWLCMAPLLTINALRVPNHFQVLCVNCAALVWNVGLSWLCHRPLLAQKRRE